MNVLNNNNSTTLLNNNNLKTNLNNNHITSKTSFIDEDNNNDQMIIETSDLLNADQPDPDYIKMFVGQVPRSMDEQQLREMFEEFGRVHQINVLRDKVSGLSKGKSHFFS